MIHFMDVTPIIRQDGLIWFRSFKRVESGKFLIEWVLIDMWDLCRDGYVGSVWGQGGSYDKF